ncbi:class I SAM-dependent DNA methyltransferase [Frankia sp. CiP3]|uniref:methylation-associated defense system DNA methyltransferase MAD2 n=1 Tax=Frankia sp. CiP3 TaxID=2880971 RepID=UPI001EF588D3|nr:N-6 DNA methylase [Frankia sp. CiP3]
MLRDDSSARELPLYSADDPWDAREPATDSDGTDIPDELGSGSEGVPAGSLGENEVIDFITGRPVKQGGKEDVRQQIAKALSVEYSVSVDDMARDFAIPVETGTGGRRGVKKADIAVFVAGSEHSLENLERVVICKPEPKAGRSVTKLRTHEQAGKDLEELELLLSSPQTPRASYGMWTNGVDFFFLHREAARFGANFEPRANWPVETSVGAPVPSAAKMRRGEAAMLKTVFRRCHNYVHGNEGLPKDAAFWQFLYVLFAKIYDEQKVRRTHSTPKFYALPREPFNPAGREAIKIRILELFEDMKRFYSPAFEPRDEITLSARALAFIVGELAAYDLGRTDVDVKGLAYQELVGTNLRGDRGQYFTPKGAVELMVRILDPKEDERVLDPACGTGGFLRETLRHLLNGWKEAEGSAGQPDDESHLLAHQERLDKYAQNNLFGADFDPFLVRASKMSVMLLTGRDCENVFHMDSLAFKHSDLPGAAEAERQIPLGSMDVVMTNPPFGTDIKIEDADILDQYRHGVAQSWARNRETGEVGATLGSRVAAASPEQLFIQRAVEWVRPGGRVGIVLPNGILSNPGPTDYAIRRWILENCWVLASVELPVETFVHEANVNILTSLLFLKRKTDQERRSDPLGGRDYPVFMAVAEKVGIDRRGNKVYKRHPDGSEILQPVTIQQTVIRNGKLVSRPIIRMNKVIDDDLPEIAAAYHEFRARYPEPGSSR